MFTLLAQDEVIKAIQALSESIAAQQQTTQLVIIIVLLLIVFGAILILILRGGIQVFNKLSTAIDRLAVTSDKLSLVEDDRHETQKDLVRAVERFSEQNERRYERVDEIWSDVMLGLSDVSRKMDNLYTLLESNPKEHEKLYAIVSELNKTLLNAKKKTDELPEID